MSLTEFSRSIHGFRLMKYLAYSTFLPSLIIFSYLMIVDRYNRVHNKIHNKIHNKSQKTPNRKIISFLVTLSIVFFCLDFGILCIRLFNQKLTGEFNVLTLVSIFFSSVLVFSNIYYLSHINDENAFIVNHNVHSSDKNYNIKTYLNYLYYSIYTLFTQGYGDIYPRKVYTRLLSCLQMLISYILTAYVFSKIIANSERIN